MMRDFQRPLRGVSSLSLLHPPQNYQKRTSSVPPKMNNEALNTNLDAVYRGLETMREPSFKMKPALWKIKCRHRNNSCTQQVDQASPELYPNAEHFRYITQNISSIVEAAFSSL